MSESPPPRTANSPPQFNMYSRPSAHVSPQVAPEPSDPSLINQNTYGAWQVVPPSANMSPQNLPEGSAPLFQLPSTTSPFLPVYYPSNAFDSFHSAPLTRMWELSSLSNPVQGPLIRTGPSTGSSGNSVPLSYPMGASLIPPHSMRLQDSFLSAHMRSAAGMNDQKYPGFEYGYPPQYQAGMVRYISDVALPLLLLMSKHANCPKIHAEAQMPRLFSHRSLALCLTTPCGPSFRLNLTQIQSFTP